MPYKNMAKESVKIDEAKMKEHWKMHKKEMAGTMLVLGLLIIANSYLDVVSWPIFAGGILVIEGILRLMIPFGCCKK